MIVPVYQSEISPADHRGKLACIEFTGEHCRFSALSVLETDFACRIAGNIIGYASSIVC